MQRRSILATLTLLLAVLLPATAAAADPPAPTIRHQFRTAGLPPTGPMEVVKWVLDFAPGAATPPHTHPGLFLGTQLEGATTFTTDGADRVYATGETLIEQPGVVGLATNKGTVRNRAIVSMVTPLGGPPSAPQPGGPTPAPPAPTTSYLVRVPAVIPSGPYDQACAILDFAPGAQTPPQTHAGQVVTTVLEGAVTVVAGGAEQTYQIGETFVEPPETIAQIRNAGAAPATLAATYLLRPGAPLATAVATPGLPATGAGGGPAGRAPTPLASLATLALGSGLLGGGLLAWRRRRRRA